MIVAVPEFVSCAEPYRWISVQWLAVASQNSTRPGVTGVNPDITVAVSVIVEPALADVTTSAPFVNASVVVVVA